MTVESQLYSSVYYYWNVDFKQNFIKKTVVEPPLCEYPFKVSEPVYTIIIIILHANILYLLSFFFIKKYCLVTIVACHPSALIHIHLNLSILLGSIWHECHNLRKMISYTCELHTPNRDVIDTQQVDIYCQTSYMDICIDNLGKIVLCQKE